MGGASARELGTPPALIDGEPDPRRAGGRAGGRREKGEARDRGQESPLARWAGERGGAGWGAGGCGCGGAWLWHLFWIVVGRRR